MDGILIIDKPAGITSHDVVARVRRTLKTRRVGHTGTLDPFATGVMVVLVGKATRLAQFLDKDEKEYEGVIQFGFETDTGDATGVRKPDPAPAATGLLSSVDWDPILSAFCGEMEQTPPMYSAKKVAGKKLYEHARKGDVIERQPVAITISKLEVLRPRNPVAIAPGTDTSLRIRVVCSAGTYIRTLAEDIGRAVGVGAHLAELRRTRAGRFGIADAITLDELDRLDDQAERLLPVAIAVEHLPQMTLTAERVERTKNGLSTRVADDELVFGEAIRMIGPGGELIAIGGFDDGENAVRPKVVLV